MTDIPIRTRARTAAEEGGGPAGKAGFSEPAAAATTLPTGAPGTPAVGRAASPAVGRAASPARGRAASAGRRASTEIRRAARGMPSRAYTAVAIGSALLALLCGLAPVLAARVLLPSSSPAFATAEQTLAGEALATVIEAARHGIAPKGLASTKKTVGLVHPYDTLLRLVGAGSAVWALAAYTLRKAAFANKLSLVTYKRLAMGLATVGGLELLLLPRAVANLSWTGVAALATLAIMKVNSPAHQVRGEGWWSLAKQCVKGMGVTSSVVRRRRHGACEVEEEARRGAGGGPMARGPMGGVLGFSYRALALLFAGGGLSYLLAPAITAKLALGTVATAPARLLWQVVGASNVGLSLVTLNLAMAAAQGRLAATTHTLECLAMFFTAATHLVLLARDWEAGRAGMGAPGLGALWAGALAAAVAGLPASHPAEALAHGVAAMMPGGGGGGGGVGTAGTAGTAAPVGGVEYERGGHAD